MSIGRQCCRLAIAPRAAGKAKPEVLQEKHSCDTLSWVLRNHVYPFTQAGILKQDVDIGLAKFLSQEMKEGSKRVELTELLEEVDSLEAEVGSTCASSCEPPSKNCAMQAKNILKTSVYQRRKYPRDNSASYDLQKYH